MDSTVTLQSVCMPSENVVARIIEGDTLIRDGDILTISPCGSYRLKSGDVAAFRNPKTGQLVIHRIVGGNSRGWIFKGDNCLKVDGDVKRSEIIGLVMKVERQGRQIRIGCGPEKRLIALLSRFSLLLTIKKLLILPRRFAAWLLSALQSLRIYRKIGSRFSGDIVITVAGEKDYEAAHRLIYPSLVYKKRPFNPNITNLVAKKKGCVIGLVQLVCRLPEHRPWDGFWLRSLHVQTRFRGLGLGEKLVGAAIDEAVKKKAPRILLLVDQRNKRAISLYHRHGFTLTNNDELNQFLEGIKARTGKIMLVFAKNLEDLNG